jgi:nuclear receptor subfamily 1 group F protein 4
MSAIQALNSAMVSALRSELNKSHKPLKGDVGVLDVLMTKIPKLREISSLHMECLTKFRRANPSLNFPDLHKELFAVEI